MKKKINTTKNSSTNLNSIDNLIYQTKSAGIELKSDHTEATLWSTFNQIADLFEVNKSTI